MAQRATAKATRPKGGTVKPRVPRAGRPATALITHQAAAEAALSMIDANGLGALSLQSVARVLGVSAPSLYHHFRGKEELLTHVARLLLEKVGDEQATWSSDWEERIIELSVAARRVMLRHPNAAPLALRFFPRRIMLPAYEKSLVDCPYPPEVQIVFSELTEKFTFGSSLFAAAAETHHIPAMPPVDVEHFPLLSRALEVAQSEEEVFIQALRVIFAGLHALYGSATKLSKPILPQATSDHKNLVV